MTEGFRIDGHFIPISYDTNNDRKLQSTELSIFCRDNDLKYDNKTNKIISAAGDYSDYDSENKLDDEKYSLENLKKRYPEAKYTIDNSNGTITVINKETGKKVITIIKMVLSLICMMTMVNPYISGIMIKTEIYYSTTKTIKDIIR